MAKDPVLPLYYNDIISSTVDWSDEEFGAYMRLLIYQWDKGTIPESMGRLKRISDSAEKNWSILSTKFPKKDGVLMNEKMEEIRNEREKFRSKQKENAAKRYQKSTKTLPNDVPESCQHDIQIDSQTPSKNLPLEVEVEIEEEVKVELEIENNYAPGKFLIVDMISVFKENIPEYADDVDHDNPALGSIVKFIRGQEKLKDPTSDSKSRETIMMIWGGLCKTIASEKFHRNQSLKTIANHIQTIVQKTKNGQNSGKSTKGFNADRANELLNSFSD